MPRSRQLWKIAKQSWTGRSVSIRASRSVRGRQDHLQQQTSFANDPAQSTLLRPSSASVLGRRSMPLLVSRKACRPLTLVVKKNGLVCFDSPTESAGVAMAGFLAGASTRQRSKLPIEEHSANDGRSWVRSGSAPLGDACGHITPTGPTAVAQHSCGKSATTADNDAVQHNKLVLSDNDAPPADVIAWPSATSL